MADQHKNPNDFKVVEVFNSTDFDFTPELGAMYDSRPLFVGSGERRQFPYHIGHLLAQNLAKAVLMRGAPSHDPNSKDPVGAPLWSETKLKALKDSFLTELYTENAPIAMSETDKLMARVAELEKLFQTQQAEKAQKGEPVKEEVKTAEELMASTPNVPISSPEPSLPVSPRTYADKAEVLAELEKRGIKHDKRSKKEDLEKLLA